MAMSIALIQPAVQAAEAVKPTAAVSESIVSKATQTLQQLEYIDGTTDGMKESSTPITRAEAAIVLQRVLDLDAPATLTGFTDVLPDNAAAPAIYALKQGELIQGNTKGYAPDAPLTRAQMASLFTRAFELKDNGIQVVYSDADQIPAVHANDAVRVKQHFIIEGSAFHAKQAVTHGGFASALYLALGLDVKQEGSHRSKTSSNSLLRQVSKCLRTANIWLTWSRGTIV